MANRVGGHESNRSTSAKTLFIRAPERKHDRAATEITANYLFGRVYKRMETTKPLDGASVYVLVTVACVASAERTAR